ncbi:MAG: GNAT family N-acetyltransferase, partial [Spirochaetaceae bacterium]|nr:GNAT family N-acetyltransferase [Spirochaetaceae bacterium]
MRIREAEDRDYAAIVDIRNDQGIAWPERARTVAAQKEIDRNRAPGKFCRRWVAEGDEGVVGFSSSVQGSPYNGKATLMVEVAVREGCRGRGLGSGLFAPLRDAALALRPVWLCADSYSIHPQGAAFLSSLGFRETWRESPVVLDVAEAPLDS